MTYFRQLVMSAEDKTYCFGCKTKQSTPLNQCSGCKSALYCDVKCQSADWKAHKPVCKAKVEARRSDFTLPLVNYLLKEFNETDRENIRAAATANGHARLSNLVLLVFKGPVISRGFFAKGPLTVGELAELAKSAPSSDDDPRLKGDLLIIITADRFKTTSFATDADFDCVVPLLSLDQRVVVIATMENSKAPKVSTVTIKAGLICDK